MESASEEKAVKHKNNLMLFHGTSQKNAEEILNNGFRNSESGIFGEGLYLTDCSDVATSFSNFYQQKSCVFLNEVLNSQKMQTEKFGKYNEVEPVDTPIDYPFTKYTHECSSKLGIDYKRDENGRFYRNSPVSKWSQCDEFVADASLVIPRYLFVMKAKVNDIQFYANERFFDKYM